MHIDDIKRGLRAEIKKRENEQYATFQCNVRQMCKDVLAKLEEQESEIAELKSDIADLRDDKKTTDSILDERNAEIAELKAQVHDYAQGLYVMQARAEKEACHHKYKRCLAMAKWCNDRYILDDCLYELGKTRFYERWEKRWLELAEKFKEAK